MPSPFPGMNPFLEQDDTWEDFHGNFIVCAQEAINRQLGPNYVAKIKVRSILHELSTEERRFIGRGSPVVDVEGQRFLEIRDLRNRKVVTIVELLSPSNKTPGLHQDNYLATRRHVLVGSTHLVEIDLRRGGTRPSPPEWPACDYGVLVCRYEKRPPIDFWPLFLRQRLPVIPIPLIAPDADVSLDLQAVLDRAYDAAQYGKYIYSEVPEPPLSPNDADWAKQFVPSVP